MANVALEENSTPPALVITALGALLHMAPIFDPKNQLVSAIQMLMRPLPVNLVADGITAPTLVSNMLQMPALPATVGELRPLHRLGAASTADMAMYRMLLAHHN